MSNNDREKQGEQEIQSLRRDYGSAELRKESVKGDPLEQFKLWFEEAIAAGVDEPNAMALATATKNGEPSVRMVLLKDFGARGFVFFTNYESDKGAALTQNPRAALLFFWGSLERQIRISGTVIKTSAEISDHYFAGRPYEARIGAHASAQSREIASRSVLEENVASLTTKFAAGEVPRPANWGGFALQPDHYEFWQGRSNRLHDRVAYRSENGAWKIARLAP